MKTARIINGIVWGTLAAIIIPMVFHVWREQACGIESLIMAVVFYAGCSAALWFSIDQRIQGK
ncbi:MAG: hypothetical protein KBS77_06420 [Bacteroidales bacterium]|nr:hypothetical protein [Candidatus Colicola faecequi]